MGGQNQVPRATWRLELKNIYGKIEIHKNSNIYKKIHTVNKLEILVRLQLKEAMHITLKMTILNKQIKHVALTLSV